MRARAEGPQRREGERPVRNKTTYALWTIQGLLAIIFLLAGGMKLAMSAEELAAAMTLPLPIAFVRFIAVCEVLGALGLVLPGIFRIRTDLTPLAAKGLVVLMIGAVTITVTTMDVSLA